MTLLSKNVAMKPKVCETRSEPVFSKQNVKMAINRTLTAKKNPEAALDGYARGTVLVNNVNATHRTPATGVRTIVSAGKSATVPGGELLRCKRKIHFISGQSYPGAQPASVARRNARERNRVKQVNNGFATLRSHIPPSVAAALASEKSTPRNSSASKKLSKVETLKMAVEYIRSLQQMLEDHNGGLEKKAAAEQVAYEKQFEMDENYYSSSPETGRSGHVLDPGQHYPDSPCRVFPKMEPLDSDYYPPRQYSKSEREEAFVKTELYQSKETFDRDLRDTLASEFYGARSPVKTYYLGQEEGDFRPADKPYEQTGLPGVPSDDGDYGLRGGPDGSPDKASEFRRRGRSPSLTVLNSVSANQVMQFAGQAFLRPHCQRSSASLSPTVSEACPSPTPSYSSDLGSVASAASAHLVGSLSRLSTHPLPPEYKTQMASPLPGSASPVLVGSAAGCLTPPRNMSPLSAASASVVPDPSSPSNQSSYSAGMDFQKGSPEGYDNYDSVSPEDEELLDVISWWQQSH